MQIRLGWRGTILIAPAALGVLVLAAHGPIPQDPSYHRFADMRAIAGIPNAGDVLSNVAFLIAGAAGLLFLARSVSGQRLPYFLFFTGVLLTAFGSTWYHLAPDNGRLVWDRLPMTIAFLSLFAAVIGERVSPNLGARLLIPLLVLGLASVFYWHVTEQAGKGDLRLYALVQYYPVVALVLLLLLYPPRFTHSGLLWGVGLLYILAKALELADGPIFRATGLVSGHTLKHLFAAAAPGLLLLMLAGRRPIEPSSNEEVS